jgi:hypothetical protein
VGRRTFDVVIDGRLVVFVFEEFDGVCVGGAHELVVVFDAVLLVVVDGELAVRDVLGHGWMQVRL